MVKATSEAVDVTLALVARGNAILAEIERLSDIIPLLFRSDFSSLKFSCNCFTQGRDQVRGESGHFRFFLLQEH